MGTAATSYTHTQRAFNLRWSIQNPKLREVHGIAFGIPALKSETGFVTCPQAGRCALICYARQSKYEMPVVKAAREHNLSFILEKGMDRFIAAASEDLGRRRSVKLVRVHDSGDFFSQEYLDAWYAIARRNETKVFTAYTTSFHLDLWNKRPSNFHVVQSEGGKLDHAIDRSRPHSRVFENRRVLEEAGFMDGTSEKVIFQGEIQKIGHIFHGRYAPDAATRVAFGWKADVEVRGQVNFPQRRSPGPQPTRVAPPENLRGILNEDQAGDLKKLIDVLRTTKENLAGPLSERAKLEARAIGLDKVISYLEQLL